MARFGVALVCLSQVLYAGWLLSVANGTGETLLALSQALALTAIGAGAALLRPSVDGSLQRERLNRVVAPRWS
jgi:hypothetical protein